MGRFFRRVSIALVALMVVTGAAAGGAVAKGPTDNSIVADLEGRRISVTEIPNWFCHDLDYPKIHCYTTAPELEAMLDDAAALGGLAGAAAAVPYVYIYGDAGTLGPSTAISEVWENLGSIGWNDKISSFKALNGLSGHFATDAYNNGRLYPFCCNVWVTYVGDSWNDQFSSVYPWRTSALESPSTLGRRRSRESAPTEWASTNFGEETRLEVRLGRQCRSPKPSSGRAQDERPCHP